MKEHDTIWWWWFNAVWLKSPPTTPDHTHRN